ncbi:hypothetical protein [Kibdelosporangium philippinense]
MATVINAVLSATTMVAIPIVITTAPTLINVVDASQGVARRRLAPA